MFRNDNRTIYLRKTVNQALDRIWEYPLTVVEAPMGYGKTIAVKEYLKDSSALVLWQALLDNSPTTFWSGLSRLFKKIDTVAAARLAGVGVPSNSIFLEEAIGIIRDIDFTEKTIIVIDDYHLLFSPDVDRFIEMLVMSGLPNLHIVIISRNVFGDNMAELVLKRYCWVVKKVFFELSRTEIIEYCELCAVKLSTEEIDFLVAYTEGWISAVYICLLGFLQDGRIERQASLYELIEKVVYRQISVEAQEFLLGISIFESFSLKQVEYTEGKVDAEELLRELMARNAFIRYDQTANIYYIHNIFSSYLRRLFAKRSLLEQQAAWQRAGKWHVNVGECMESLEYFYKAQDFDSLLTAVEIDKGNGIWGEYQDKIILYFTECPGAIKRKHLEACMIYAINLFSFNEMELFAQECAEIGAYIEELSGEEEQFKEQMAGQLDILCSFAQYNDINAMMQHIERADRLLNKPAEFIDKNSSWTFGAPSVLYMFYRESGKLAQEVAEMNVAMKSYCHLTAGHGAGAREMMEAEWYYNIGDFENAEIFAHKALHNACTDEQTAIILCAKFLKLRLAVIKGELAVAMNGLLETRKDIVKQGLYPYLHTWEMCEGFIYSYLNQEKNIPGWIVNGDLADSTIFFPSYAFFNIVWGKALLLSGQYLKLIGLADSFNEIAGVFPNLLGHVYTYIYEAAANYKLGRREEAQVILRKAADIAAPDQLVMPFIENSEYLSELLNEDKFYASYPKLITALQELMPLIENNKTMMLQQVSSSKKLPLTERELSIAELVASGLSNRVIGETLYIAEVTVKKALQNIYGKLGVSSRTALAKIIIEQRTS